MQLRSHVSLAQSLAQLQRRLRRREDQESEFRTRVRKLSAVLREQSQFQELVRFHT